MPPAETNAFVAGAAAAGTALGVLYAAGCLAPASVSSLGSGVPASAGAVAAPALDHWGAKGKLVVVSGGANGIGRAVAVEFARQGAFVVAADIDEKEGATLVAEAGALAGQIMFVKADMSSASVPAKLIKQAMEWQGGAAVSVLVNNVGIQIDNGESVEEPT